MVVESVYQVIMLHLQVEIEFTGLSYACIAPYVWDLSCRCLCMHVCSVGDGMMVKLNITNLPSYDFSLSFV